MSHIKNIWKIFVDDLKRITMNPVAIIIALGLIILPSLYAGLHKYHDYRPSAYHFCGFTGKAHLS
ncbi:hypothetical protein LXJ15735_03140 [Lacrimispora xylanolytica]